MSGVFRYLAAIAWLGATGAGLAGLWRYSLTPAEMTEGAGKWPAASLLEAPAGRPSLVLFLHPECPCSRATVDELGVLLTRQPGKLSVQVVFFTPEEKTAEWADSSLRHRVESLPGVRTVADKNGHEAALFGALTSGETLVYSPAGVLIFHGGLTAARGHAGDNAGLSAVEALAERGSGSGFTGTGLALSPAGNPETSPSPFTTPVFGCSLGSAETGSPALQN